MIKRSEKLLITFHTTTAAMAMERVCREQGAPGRLIPVPGAISADCGLCWCAEPACEGELLRLMKDHGISHQGGHVCIV